MKRAFTLIELIVVIAIIAILAAIIAPNAFRAIEKAKISRAVSDIRAIKTAALSFFADTGKIPCTKSGGWGKDPGFVFRLTTATCWDVELNPGEDCTTPDVCVDIYGWNGPYLEKWSRSPWYKRIPGSPLGYGGAYDWEKWLSYPPRVPGVSCGLGGAVTLESYGAVPINSLRKIDSVLDNGDLDTGWAYSENVGGGLGDPVEPDYFQQFVICN